MWISKNMKQKHTQKTLFNSNKDLSEFESFPRPWCNDSSSENDSLSVHKSFLTNLKDRNKSDDPKG